MKNPKFDEAYKRLNPAQKTAVETIDGPVMVVAGPGTGKTQVLTLRIANILLKTDINPENILALTFTEAAAKQMRRRLVEMIGTPGYRVMISTFHGFCNDVIKRYEEDFPEFLMSESIQEADQIEIMEQLITETELKLLKPFGEPLYHARNVLSAIGELKKEGVTPEILEKILNQQEIDFDKIEDLYHEKGQYKGKMKGMYLDLQKSIAKNKELVILYRLYQQHLSKMRLYDFNDMLTVVNNALETNQDLVLRLQEKYQYILVDEHQDTNTVQNQIIERLSEFYAPNPNLFVVGDEKQAIYRFQGASLENFLYFQSLYPSAVLINLEDNYRSHQLILDAAYSVIKNNFKTGMQERNPMLVARNGSESEKIKVVGMTDVEAELEYVADDIKQAIESGVAPSQIGVIARKNRDLEKMAAVLARKKIDYAISADTAVLEDIEIRKLLLILQAIADFGDGLKLVEAMHVDFLGIDPVEIYRLIRQSRVEKLPLVEMLEKRETDDAMSQFYKQVKQWESQMHNEPLEQLFVSVMKTSGFLNQVVELDRRVEIIEKLNALFGRLKEKSLKNPDFGLKEFLNHLEVLTSHGMGLEIKNPNTYREAVQLMTAHKAKGLEFEQVYMINLLDGVWGNVRARSSGINLPWDLLGVKLIEGDGNEDERRIFYVGLTRAKKKLMLSYATRSLDGKEQLPTQFVSEIEPELLDVVDIAEFEKQFLERKEVIFEPSQREFGMEQLKGFVNEVFNDEGLNPTSLNNYLDCPWRYFFVSLVRLPEVQNNSQIFGTAVHRVLNCYLKNRELSRDELWVKFEEVVDRSFLSQADKESVRREGQAMMEPLYELVMKKLPENVEGEVAIKGVKLAEGVMIGGRLDMVEELGGGKVRVHDFKTGKPKSRKSMEEGNDQNYYRQLIFYKLLVDHYYGGKRIMDEGVIDFVKADEKGQVKSEGWQFGEEQVKGLEQMILGVSKEIKELGFWDRRCDDADCQYCQLEEMLVNKTGV